jgi:hypothetical protein
MHIPSAGSCILDGSSDPESIASALTDKDKERIASIEGMKELTNREAVMEYLELKKTFTASNSNYPCEVRQMMLSGAYSSLILKRALQ